MPVIGQRHTPKITDPSFEEADHLDRFFFAKFSDAVFLRATTYPSFGIILGRPLDPDSIEGHSALHTFSNPGLFETGELGEGENVTNTWFEMLFMCNGLSSYIYPGEIDSETQLVYPYPNGLPERTEDLDAEDDPLSDGEFIKSYEKGYWGWMKVKLNKLPGTRYSITDSSGVTSMDGFVFWTDNDNPDLESFQWRIFPLQARHVDGDPEDVFEILPGDWLVIAVPEGTRFQRIMHSAFFGFFDPTHDHNDNLNGQLHDDQTDDVNYWDFPHNWSGSSQYQIMGTVVGSGGGSILKIRTTAPAQTSANQTYFDFNGTTEIQILKGSTGLYRFQDQRNVHVSTKAWIDPFDIAGTIRVQFHDSVDGIQDGDVAQRLSKPLFGWIVKRPLELNTSRELYHFVGATLLRTWSRTNVYTPKEGDVARMLPFNKDGTFANGNFNRFYIGKLFQYTNGDWKYAPGLWEPTVWEFYGSPSSGDYWGSWLISQMQGLLRKSKITAPGTIWGSGLSYGAFIPRESFTDPDTFIVTFTDDLVLQIPENSVLSGTVDLFKVTRKYPTAGWDSVVGLGSRSFEPGGEIRITFPQADETIEDENGQILFTVGVYGRVNWNFPDGL